MTPIRKLLLVGVGVLALHGVQACANETELNPQPLPPQGETTPVRDPDDKGTDNSSGGATGGSSGSSGVPASAADGGADADSGPDASDAGAD